MFINYDGNKAFRTNNILKTYCKRECDNTEVNRMIGLDGNHNYMGKLQVMIGLDGNHNYMGQTAGYDRPRWQS